MHPCKAGQEDFCYGMLTECGDRFFSAGHSLPGGGGEWRVRCYSFISRYWSSFPNFKDLIYFSLASLKKSNFR